MVPRYFNRKGHWVRNPNHTLPRRRAVWGLLLAAPPHMDIPPPARAAALDLPATLFGDQSAEDKYETLLRFQAASDEFYHQKRASCKSQVGG